MPVFRLSKVLNVRRGIKVFLNLQAGATRGKVPEPWRPCNQAKTLEKKDWQIKRGRQRIRGMKKSLQRQRSEVFRLRNQLEAMNELAKSDLNSASASRTSTQPEIGTLPDFVIIGAQKCGTTHLYNVLTQHPNVEAAAVNEVHFFDQTNHYNQGIEWYRQFFLKPKWENGRRSITGEKTPNYLFHPKVPERMAQVMPEARLIALLRNPVDRAYSHYHHVTRLELETRSFEEALEAEEVWLANEDNNVLDYKHPPAADRGSPPSGLLARGIYVDQLVRWRRFFGEGQMLVLKSEDLFEHTTEILEKIQNFLKVPRHKLGGSSRKPKSRYEPMNSDTRKRLETFFEPHNRRLYELLGRDFGW